jgi:hypothetical protein
MSASISPNAAGPGRRLTGIRVCIKDLLKSQ